MGLSGATVLAIDAGNSKTDVAVVGIDGSLLGATRGGPFLPHVVGAEVAVAGLVPLVDDACRRAGVDGVAHVSACLANADLPVEHEALQTAIAGRGWAPSTEVVNDTFALLRAGVDDRRGVAVVCGAGINCSGLLPDGTTAWFAAVGTISGDWGGGGMLWQEAMWWAARAEDGRGPDTALRSALPRHVGLRTMAELIEAVHLHAVPLVRCLELTPVLFDVADAGDPVAGEVVRRQGAEVVALAAAAIRRLGVLDQPIDVVLGGGVLTAGHMMLMEAIERGLAEAAPYAVPRVVSAPPVVGAVLLGLDRLGGDPEAAARVREAFRQPVDQPVDQSVDQPVDQPVGLTRR